MKKGMFVCFFIFMMSVFYLSVPSVVFGQSVQEVFNEYHETFRHADIHEFFPKALRALKDPDIQSVLHPIVIRNIANDPKSIQDLAPETDIRIVVALTVDNEFNRLFRDKNFHEVVQDPVQIEELATLIEGLEPLPPEGCEIPERDTPRPTTLVIVSGFGQQGRPGTRLQSQFIVEVQDQYGEPLPDINVNFGVTAGGGDLSPTTAKTTNLGRASTRLTLGSEAGENRVVASVSGIQLSQTFIATAIEPPKATTLTIVSGFGQRGEPGSRLPSPFVVEVRDQYGKPLSGATVNFAVLPGQGQISPAMAATNNLGRASTRLTLGPEPGANLVVASVDDIALEQVFMAIATGSDGTEPPKPTALSIVKGNAQQGLPGTQLKPFFVAVYDQNGDTLPEVSVNFSVSKGNGKLTKTQVSTNDFGLAETILTLGREAGINEVKASVEGISWDVTFTATAIERPRATTLAMVSGSAQEGEPETRLEPFVVEVRDQYGKLFSGATVNFRVETGGGSLSGTTARTNTNGRASVTLTLGLEAGENRVVASVSGIQLSQTFTTTATSPDDFPKSFDEDDLDVNGDGFVNTLDLTMVISLIIQHTQNFSDVENIADVNDDGTVDITDMLLVASELSSIAAAPSMHVLLQEGVSARDVQELLTQAKALPETTRTDPVYQRGIIVLERLLTTLTKMQAVPKQTALLVNYPNPFNPETWIPYQLSEASDVTVGIYAVDGRLIRTLALGHQPAGLYQRKNRAAYWDGHNEFGEPVASGLYFYTLTAGDFTATRKMLIRK